jgi:hypothetical protein
MSKKTASELFEDSFFASAGKADHTAAGIAIRPAGEMDMLASGKTALRFTTAKAKIRGLKVTATDKGYLISAPKGGLLRQAFDLGKYIMADNQMKLKFSEELMNFEPDEELIHKSKVPLWVLKSNPNGSVSIERTWTA